LEHRQQLEQNKLHMMVLRHQIDGLKIQDQLRARELAQQHLQLLHGQPAADLPSENVQTAQPNLPSQSLAGMMTNLIANPNAPGMNGAGPPTPAADVPASLPAPQAQAMSPGVHPMTMRRPLPVQIPGVSEMGIPGAAIRPQSLEDLLRAETMRKLAEPFDIAPGHRRMVGGAVVAEGAPEFRSVGAGGAGYLDEQGQWHQVAPGRAPAGEPTVTIRTMENGRLVTKVVPRSQAAGTYDTPLSGAYDPQRQTQRDYKAAQREWLAGQRGIERDEKGNIVLQGSGDPNAPKPVFAFPSFDEWRATQRPAGTATGTPPSATTSADGRIVTLNGRPFRFPTKAAADAFKKDMGLR
jgi:hypothetical protein